MAAFLANLFGFHEPTVREPFAIAPLDHGTFVQFAEPDLAAIQIQHYAFLVDDEQFDAIHHRLRDGGIEHWAKPRLTRPGETNTNHGGQGVYFLDPAGHGMEVITRPYDADD